MIRKHSEERDTDDQFVNEIYTDEEVDDFTKLDEDLDADLI